MHIRSIPFFLVFFLELVFCQNSIDLEGGLKQIQDQVPELGNFNQSSVNVDDIEKAFKEKCSKRGSNNTVDLLKEEQENVKSCVEKYINATQIQEELEEAQKTGSMDEVFAKYCRKWPDIYSCFDKASSYMRQCMDTKEEEAFNKTLDIIKELKEFMCFKDGDRLAMFVAEGGVECIKEQQEGVQRCANETLHTRIPDASDFSPSSLPSFVFSPNDCSDFDKLRECVNTELEKCEDSTPANIVDAFFKFLKKQMPCQTQISKMNGPKKLTALPSSSWSVAANALLIATMLLFRF